MDDRLPRSEELRESERVALGRPVLVKRIRLTESALERLARQIGTAAGTTVALMRDARKKVNERDLWTTTNPLSDLRPTARGRSQELGFAASLHAQEWRRAALERVGSVPESTEAGRLRAFGRRTTARHRRAKPIVVAALLGIPLVAGLIASKIRQS
jgi:hypothetical protein